MSDIFEASVRGRMNYERRMGVRPEKNMEPTQAQADFKQLEAMVQTITAERAELLRTIATMAARNKELEDMLIASAPRKIQIGDRVLANDKAGFHQGARGTVQFVEPGFDYEKCKVWILRDGSTSPVFYLPFELDVTLKVEDAKLDQKENG